MSTPTSQDIIHAYRHLYRGLLHAVRFSSPAKFVVRDRLRHNFRKSEPSAYKQEKIDNTVEFLRLATRETGLEHKILKSLVHTAYSRSFKNRVGAQMIKRSLPQWHKDMQKKSTIHHEMTIAMLNDSMGLCL